VKKKVLAMVASGLRAKDIAGCLASASGQSKLTWRKSGSRLRAKTAAHAVSIAIGMGMIHAEPRPMELMRGIAGKTAARAADRGREDVNASG
jgi:hypothetical protein